MILYRTHRNLVDFDAEHQLLMVKSWKFGLEDETKNVMEFLLKTIKDKRLSDIVFDLSDWPTGLAYGMHDWLLDDFAPRCLLADMENVAIVIPTDPLSFFETTLLMAELKNVFNIKFFKTVAYAKAWVLNRRQFSMFRLHYN